MANKTFFLYFSETFLYQKTTDFEFDIQCEDFRNLFEVFLNLQRKYKTFKFVVV